MNEIHPLLAEYNRVRMMDCNGPLDNCQRCKRRDELEADISYALKFTHQALSALNPTPDGEESFSDLLRRIQKREGQ